jgi:hypothetical protein
MTLSCSSAVSPCPTRRFLEITPLPRTGQSPTWTRSTQVPMGLMEYPRISPIRQGLCVPAVVTIWGMFLPLVRAWMAGS